MIPRSILSRLDAARDAGPAAGIVDSDGRFTSTGEVAASASRIATNLKAHGFVPGDHVLFAVRPGATAIALMLGIIEAGGTLVVADLGVGEKLFVERMNLIKPGWIVAESALIAASASPFVRKALRRRGRGLLPLEKLVDANIVRIGFWLPAFMAPLSLESLDLQVDKNVVPSAQSDISSTSPVLVVFTSGTTTKPKAVVHSRRSMDATLEIISSRIAMSPGDVMYAGEIHLILPALMAGARAVMPPYGTFSPARMVADLEEHGVSHFFSVTAECQRVLDYCMSKAVHLPQSVRHAFIGAAPVHAAFLRRFRMLVPETATVWSLYGMTEMLPVAAIRLDEKLAYCGDGDIIGQPVEGVYARIEAGELVLQGPNLFTRYVGESPVEEHFTGDLAEIVEGRIVLLGRKKDMMIRGRYNIYPGLHEPVVETIPGVRRCAMVGIYDNDRHDELIVLVVEPESGVDATALERRVSREIRTGSARIDEAALPDRILVMPLPEGGRSRKIDKAAVRALARERYT